MPSFTSAKVNVVEYPPPKLRSSSAAAVNQAPSQPHGLCLSSEPLHWVECARWPIMTLAFTRPSLRLPYLGSIKIKHQRKVYAKIIATCVVLRLIALLENRAIMKPFPSPSPCPQLSRSELHNHCWSLGSMHRTDRCTHALAEVRITSDATIHRRRWRPGNFLTPAWLIYRLTGNVDSITAQERHELHKYQMLGASIYMRWMQQTNTHG